MLLDLTEQIENKIERLNQHQTGTVLLQLQAYLKNQNNSTSKAYKLRDIEMLKIHLVASL